MDVITQLLLFLLTGMAFGFGVLVGRDSKAINDDAIEVALNRIKSKGCI